MNVINAKTVQLLRVMLNHAEQGHIGDVCIIAHDNNNPRRPYGCWNISDANEFKMIGGIRWVLQLVTAVASRSAAEDAQKAQAEASQAAQPPPSGSTGILRLVDPVKTE